MKDDRIMSEEDELAFEQVVNDCWGQVDPVVPDTPAGISGLRKLFRMEEPDEIHPES